MDTKKSEELFLKAKNLMPGGVNSPVRAFNAVGGTPLFISRAKGSKIYDVDGNEFIDYVCSWGPMILGHAHEKVIEAVQKACAYGLSYGAPTKKESELAELIKECMPCVEMLRMVSSGTEAVMSAVRASRGYTGRDMIIKFSGCYHGHSDGLLVKAGSGLISNSSPDSAGVPKSYAQNTLIAQYNNKKSVEELFEKYGENIACLIVEPVAANMGVVPPKDGFLSFLREITRKNGALLIFDEVITGFRLSIGGACQYYGIEPDMVTLGKIVGGGMPAACYGGKKEIMEVISPVGKVYQAGTLSGNPIATTAGIETIKILMNNTEIYKSLDEKAAKIEAALSSLKNVTVNRVGSLLSAFFTNEPVFDYNSASKSNTAEYSKFFFHMLGSGVYMAPSQFEAMFVSNAHSEEDIEKTINAIKSF